MLACVVSLSVQLLLLINNFIPSWLPSWLVLAWPLGAMLLKPRSLLSQNHCPTLSQDGGQTSPLYLNISHPAYIYILKDLMRGHTLDPVQGPSLVQYDYNVSLQEETYFQRECKIQTAIKCTHPLSQKGTCKQAL